MKKLFLWERESGLRPECGCGNEWGNVLVIASSLEEAREFCLQNGYIDEYPGKGVGFLQAKPDLEILVADSEPNRIWQQLQPCYYDSCGRPCGE